MRILIELDDGPESLPAGRAEWDSSHAVFSGWIELLRVLEGALRESSAPADRGTTRDSPGANQRPPD